MALPGLGAAASGAAPPDVVVRFGQTPRGLPDALERGANWELAERALLVSIPGLAHFLIREAGEILVEAAPEASPDDLAIFVAGPLLGLFLHLRGRIVLQASAVAVAGGAVLFCGPATAGKSTLAAALGRRGYPMVCDDVCAIDLPAAGGARALADAATLKLWAQAARRLELPPGPPVRARLQKHHVTPPAGRVDDAPVRAIYVLREARPSDTAGIERANIVDLAILVRRSAFRPSVVRALGQPPAYLAATTRLASGAGVFLLTRELGFERLDGVLDELEAHWAEIGLAPGRAA